MELQSCIVYGISVIAIALGFIALLKQKTYVDSSTNQPTEVKIPILGRLKTNYPSLLFVFLGFFAAMYAFKEFRIKEKVQWTIKGKFEDKNNRIRNWKEGELNIRPSNFQARVDSNGVYTIDLKLDKGVPIEKVVEFIDYSHPFGNALLYTVDTSVLNKKTDHCRFYKPIPLDYYY